MNVDPTIALLDSHYEAFFSVAPYADATRHPVPMDTRGWSQILVSVLVGTLGAARKKGADLIDGSDVKAANTWGAIDTPRFNGVIKSGTQAAHSGKLASLDATPYLFFVLWDTSPRGAHRCRIWAVSCPVDTEFRAMAKAWYDKRDSGEIISDNFQLHPPRGTDSDVFRNTCGNLTYPLLLCAERIDESGYQLVSFDPDALTSGRCTR